MTYEKPEVDFPGEAPDDLTITDITVGDGAEAAAGNTVVVHYVGVAHSSGEEFDASTPWQYFTDHEEEWLAESIRAGRQAEFAEHGWSGNVPDPQDPGTVDTSTLNWADLDDPERQEFLDWHNTVFRTPEFEAQEKRLKDFYLSKAAG